MADILQIRRDTAANWTSANPVLANGEQGYETDTHNTKVGDGVTAWTSLSYVTTDPSAHAATHTNGADDIQNATNTQKGVATAAQITKLEGVETGATKYPDTGEQAFLDADHTKLDGIETGATKYPDTGEQAFLDADHTKLDGIETGATKYPDTGEQAFLDADHTKLNGIEALATVDQTGAEIKTAYEAETDAYTDTKNTKLDGVEALADVTDATNVDAAGAVMESDIKDQSFVNLLENGDFESWSAGAAAAPDGWVIGGTGASVARSTDSPIGSYSATLTYGSGTAQLNLYINDYARYAGRRVSFAVWAKTSTASCGRVLFNDGHNNFNTNTHTGGGDWELLVGSFVCNAALTQIRIVLLTEAAGNVLYDGAILVEGSVCPAFSPKPLADDGQSIVIDSTTNQVTIDGTVMNAVEAGADVTDATNVDAAGAVMESDIKDQSFTNLLENGDFESWSAGAAVAPDGYYVGNATIVRSATHKIGTYSAALTATSISARLYGQADEYTRYLGKVVTFAVWVKSTVANATRLKIVDGIGTSYSVQHTGGGDWELLRCTRTIDASATKVECFMYVDESAGTGTAYFDGAMLVEGSVCPAFSPKPLPDVGVGVAEFVGDPSTQSFTNLVENGDFESWSAGASAAPDGYAMIAGTIARSTTRKKGNYSAMMTTDVAAETGMRITATTAQKAEYSGLTMIVGFWVKTDTAFLSRLRYVENDGSGSQYSYSDYHTGGGDWEFLSVKRTMRTGLTTLLIDVLNNSGLTATSVYVDGAILVEGAVCPAFSPKPLPDDGQSIVIDSTTNQVTIDGTVMNAVEAGADVTDATNVDAAGAVMESDIPDQSFTNLLENGDFESWSAGASAAPDGWVLTGAGASVARGTDEKIGTYAANITRSGTNCYLRCDAVGTAYYAGRTVTVGCWVKTTVADTCRIRLIDSANDSAYSDYHSGGGAYELLTATLTLNAAATFMYCRLYVNSNDTTAYFDGAILVEGSVCPAFSPKPLADVGVGVAEFVEEPSAQSFTNLIENGDFESWSAGTSAAPDGWVLAGVSASILRESTIIKQGTYSVKLTNSIGNDAYINQRTPQNADLRLSDFELRTYTFGCWMYADTANRCYIRVFDDNGTGYEESNSLRHPGDSTWHFITVTRVFRDNLINDIIIRPAITSGSSLTVYIAGAILVEGSVCPAFSPKPLPDDGQSIVIDSTTNQVTIDGTVMNAVEAGADVTDATNVNAAGAVMESDIPDQSFTNLLENGDFESWSAGAAAAPDGWAVTDGTVARDSTIFKKNSHSAHLTATGVNGRTYAAPSNIIQYRGVVMTFGVWARCTNNNKANINITDSTDSVTTSIPGGDVWTWVTVTKTIDVATVSVFCRVFIDTVTGNEDVYLDGAMLVEGSVCPAFSPKPLVDDGVMLHVKTPSAANAAGVQGQICTDAAYIYVCTATDTWERVAIATW